MDSLPPHDQTQLCRWHAFADAEQLARAAATDIEAAARQSVALRGTFHLALAGGTTPRRVYELLRQTDTDWVAWHIYLGDERCLQPDDPDRNSWMVQQAWLNHVAIPPAQIHLIPAELGPKRAAARYAATLATIRQFDLVLLGLGEDGHTASLFPGQDAGTKPSSPTVLAVLHAPKPPPQRVSLSAYRLGQARQVMFLVSGSAKRNAVEAWRRGDTIPAAQIRPSGGVDIYTEQELLS